MSIFKCKMCGGSLEVAAGETIIECEYCGTQQTLPKTTDENIQALFNRANLLRQKNEFDKAEAVYEKILEADDTEAEAYWGVILCKFGIEYVEDPKTYKRIPTCHRTSYDSIVADEYYKKAIENADITQRTIYEAEAKKIDEIQKGILAISAQEEPYDVFICYKETDESGRRTQDSVIANDIYYQLTQEGFKVFYAAITLEDKLGSAYEPIIFAALNSSKVMLSIGTKPEYFSAVWVKNEWSRFLKMMKNDRSKMLIPCYKGMDAYELPEEFAHLQAQDMGKIGFINDIVRGIKKVIVKDEPKTTVVKETVVTSANPSVDPLLKRAFMFLDDEEWDSAKEYAEKVLDIDPENAKAYLVKFLAEYDLKNCSFIVDAFSTPFFEDESADFQKAMRFADDALREELNGYIKAINDRNEHERLQGIYDDAKAKMRLNTHSSCLEAAKLFESISTYLDAQKMIGECREKAEVCRKNDIYNNATSEVGKASVASFVKAIELFKSISGWKDADEQVAKCEAKLPGLRDKEEKERIEREQKAEQERIEKAKRAKRNKMIAIITTPIVFAIIAFIIVLNVVIIPNGKYNDAIALMDAGKYNEAISAFEALDGYKDSVAKISECNTAIIDDKYNSAIVLMSYGKYTEAISVFETLGGYKDSSTKISECQTAILHIKYNKAVELLNSNKYSEAYNIFVEIGNYKDSVDKANNTLSIIIKNSLKNVKAGDIIKFGTYSQDRNKYTNNEEIEWIVLEVSDGKAFIVSRKILDNQRYNNSRINVTWETCSLRQWLNNDFFSAAFSDAEKQLISSTTVLASGNYKNNTDPGNNTTDKIFLLSIDELNKYFPNKSDKTCQPTYYAQDQGASPAPANGNCQWLLRSPGSNQSLVSYIDGVGSIIGGPESSLDGGYVDNKSGIRPAMWIEVE